jgi:hypothetical protein
MERGAIGPPLEEGRTRLTLAPQGGVELSGAEPLARYFFSGRTGSGFVGGGFTDPPIHINETTGRFKAESFRQGGESSFLTKIRGTVHRTKITGYIYVRADVPAPPQTCVSGNANDPWVHFVAPRSSGPRPFG